MVASWMMNKRSQHGVPYEPTEAEHIANICTHAAMIPLGLVASLMLMSKSWSLASFIVAAVYGVCLITLFCVSTAFHSVFYLNSNKEMIEKLRKSDRAVIYLFIAACYSPWLILVQSDDWFFTHLRWLIWTLAFLGVTFELTCSKRFPVCGILFYVLYGLIPAVILNMQMSFPGVSELKFSGALYLIGVLFFRSDGIVPFAHAIWHICVILGVSTHYISVYKYFYGDPIVYGLLPTYEDIVQRLPFSEPEL